MYDIEENGHRMGFLKKFMMENAGAAAVRILCERVPDIASKEVLILAGMGNNGGDGLVMARHLAGHGARVTVILLGTHDRIRTEESSWNWSILKKMPSVRLMEGCDSYPGPDVIVDAILGTGIAGDIREPYASAIRHINGTECFTMAVDVPSGLDPETGLAATPSVRADVTVTFHKMKRGIPQRPDLTGHVYVEKIGIPPEAEEGVL
jgi:NAD(P)H-hydrate epimerase